MARRLTIASLNHYALEKKGEKKEKKKLHNTFHWSIPDFPGRTDKK